MINQFNEIIKIRFLSGTNSILRMPLNPKLFPKLCATTLPQSYGVLNSLVASTQPWPLLDESTSVITSDNQLRYPTTECPYKKIATYLM